MLDLIFIPGGLAAVILATTGIMDALHYAGIVHYAGEDEA